MQLQLGEEGVGGVFDQRRVGGLHLRLEIRVQFGEQLALAVMDALRWRERRRVRRARFA